jgi:ABC-2 type transport system permease protein
MQAMQLSIFFYLPSMLLSGFMFPFYGMPKWAQWLGELLPLTHFLRIVRGILLKGLQNIDAWSLAYPILLFGLFVTFLSFYIYHKSK